MFVYLDDYDYMFDYYGMPEYMSFVVSAASLTIQTVNAGYYNFSLLLTSTEGETITVTKSNIAIAVPENNYNPSTGTGGTTGGGTTTQADYTGEPTAVSTVTEVMNAGEVDDYYFQEYGDVDLYLYKVQNGDTLAVLPLYFYVDNLDPDIQIPAGTYPLASTYASGTVEASEGYVYSSTYGRYYPTAAYLAYLDADGYISSIYYLVSGTVTVVKNADNTMNVTLAATSGNGSTINVTYSTSPAGNALESVATGSDARKFFENGQLIILKNGQRFNSLGQSL